MTATVTSTYYVTYRVGDGQPDDVADGIIVAGGSVDLAVLEARPTLIVG